MRFHARRIPRAQPRNPLAWNTACEKGLCSDSIIVAPISPFYGYQTKLIRLVKTLQKMAYGFRDMDFLKLKIKGLHETKYALVG
uniref:Transposase n=1 Tax=Candidatus Kentrum sp. LFY TaxID=2126342 RepID=A0A450USX8_9GAMM|nr:MAG: hypothetical protein BECKLFY1418A_GA0070994_105221 [Candidatus Kentron sp. LFY]